MRAQALKTEASQPSNSELFQRHCKKAEIIHHFAENLAQTLGVFHGINEGKKLAVEGDGAMAVDTILFDQLQIMVIRLCALCSSGSRKEDASIGELVDGLSDKRFQRYLIEKEQKWRNAVGARAGLPDGEIPKFIRILKARYAALQGETDALDRIRHYRNKVLAHATIGLDPERKAIIGEIWRLSRLALSVAKYIRLVLEREEWNYLEHSDDAKARGRVLVLALHRDSKAQS